MAQPPEIVGPAPSTRCPPGVLLVSLDPLQLADFPELVPGSNDPLGSEFHTFAQGSVRLTVKKMVLCFSAKGWKCFSFNHLSEMRILTACPLPKTMEIPKILPASKSIRVRGSDSSASFFSSSSSISSMSDRSSSSPAKRSA